MILITGINKKQEAALVKLLEEHSSHIGDITFSKSASGDNVFISTMSHIRRIESKIDANGKKLDQILSILTKKQLVIGGRLLNFFGKK